MAEREIINAYATTMNRLVLLLGLFALAAAAKFDPTDDDDDDVDHGKDLFRCKFTKNITVDGQTEFAYDDCKMVQGKRKKLGAQKPQAGGDSPRVKPDAFYGPERFFGHFFSLFVTAIF